MRTRKDLNVRGLKRWNHNTLCILLLLWAAHSGNLGFAGAGQAADDEQVVKDLLPLSIEALMDIEVISPGKKKQKLSKTAAAIYVITQEDIRRGGYRSIPEALRVVPGLAVARVDASRWAVSARGFNGVFNSKQLVLMDGRSVYTPLFGGMFWDVQDTLLADIDRIEVIRGPGGTLWGANAVNGVINIITKQATATQGTYFSSGGGNLEQGFVDVRYGGRLGEKGAYRIYGKYFNRDNFRTAPGSAANDAWDQGRIGFRSDWTVSPKDSLTVQGDGYLGSDDQTALNVSLTSPFAFSNLTTVKVGGGNLLMRWKRMVSDSSNLTLQLYYDHTQRDQPNFGIKRNTYDIDLQHRFGLGTYQDFVWGFGYRLSQDSIKSSFRLSFMPNEQNFEIINTFVQDEIHLIPDRLRLTLGTKVSHNTFTGVEFQPNARLLWNPHPHHTVWTAISRAVRFPTRIERTGRLNIAATPTPTLTLSALRGNSSFQSEELVAYEIGYRVKMPPHMSVDVAAFYNVYSRIVSLRRETVTVELTPGPAHALVPLRFSNDVNGNTYGIEVATRWQATSWWKLSANYTWLGMRLSPPPTMLRPGISSQPGNSPKHQFQIRSMQDLPHDLTLDTAIYYVSSLPNLGVADYTRVDLRLAWQPVKGVEVSLVGQNVFDNQHPEFILGGATALAASSEVPRSVYGQLAWSY